jgi:hypothetical protein
MAVITLSQCDRCKAQVERTHPAFRMGIVQYRSGAQGPSTQEREHPVDLCHECFQNLIEWFGANLTVNTLSG